MKCINPGPVLVVAVCSAVTCSYTTGEVHVRLRLVRVAVYEYKSALRHHNYSYTSELSFIISAVGELVCHPTGLTND